MNDFYIVISTEAFLHCHFDEHFLRCHFDERSEEKS